MPRVVPTCTPGAVSANRTLLLECGDGHSAEERNAANVRAAPELDVPGHVTLCGTGGDDELVRELSRDVDRGGQAQAGSAMSSGRSNLPHPPGADAVACVGELDRALRA